MFQSAIRYSSNHTGVLKIKMVSEFIIYKIDEIRQQQGLSRNQLAKKLGWDKSRLSKYMNKSTNLKIETAAEIFHAMGYNLSFSACEMVKMDEL